MFGPDSRYAGIEDTTLEVPLPDGSTRTVTYRRRRFLPRVDRGTTVAAHRVTAGDRLDLLAYSSFGQATAFWRLCDANPVIHPRELLADVGGSIRIALPEMGP